MKVVAKFGGSCITAQNLDKVRTVVKANPYIKYAVVSAVGKVAAADKKTTDLLIACHQKGDKKILEEIVGAHLEIKEKFGLSCDIEKIIRRSLRFRTSYARTVSRGEFFAGVMVSELLGWRLIDTQNLVKFDLRGSLDTEKSSRLLAKALGEGQNAVVTGFYGSNPLGKTVTFSRGGSDITGSLIADAADAMLYENWTDVDGFLIANPSKVFNPRPIECISYSQLSGLNRIGADVLHPFTVLPLIKKSIPLHIRNIYNPLSAGTLVTQTANKSGLLAITSFEAHYSEYDKTVPQSIFPSAKFFNADTSTRVLTQTMPENGLKPKISARAEYIQAVFYGKIDLDAVAALLKNVYYIGQTANTLSVIAAPQPDAVQKIYDYFM